LQTPIETPSGSRTRSQSSSQLFSHSNDFSKSEQQRQTSTFGVSHLSDSIIPFILTHPPVVSLPLENSLPHDFSRVFATSFPPLPPIDFKQSDSLVVVHASFIFLSTLFQSTDFAATSIDLIHSNIWNFQTKSDGSSDSAFASGGFSVGAIVGIVVGILVLLGAVFVVIFLFHCWRHKKIPISPSGEIPYDLEFTDSTLHETLFISSDTVTIDVIIPNTITTFPSEYPTIQSLM
jgi:hypothetical protein